ncbi:hypothetical protein [Sporosarcina luteola]|uniref:hypothetical protein n=1 Tax=Sporosarcina luteola TaxID=582850 RepID=UPI0020418E97|nr:hypothetical protein [Sporosarcina luteola]MCM3712413.1 hypothetical protein [Sporosarcina luteola]
MKKFVIIGAFFVLVLGVVWFYNNQMKNTIFGEVFKEVFEDKEITKVVIEERQKKSLNEKDNHWILEEETFRELMSQSSEMKIKETNTPPMTTYEITIHYKAKGEEKENVTAIVVGYNNTLQMANGKFYAIEGRNVLFESIYREM